MTFLTNPSELKSKKTFKGLIYGQPGIGKTTLALSAPRPVLLDFDKGVDRVMPQFRVPSLQVENYQQVIDFILSGEMDKFETVVVDTIGKLVDCICDHVATENSRLRQADGQMSIKGWGVVKYTFQAFFKLLASKNKSLIFVAHESEEKNGDEVTKRPDCSGSARKDVVKELDFMGYMEAINNKRAISFSPSNKFYAKNSIGINETIEVEDLKFGNNFISEKIVKLTNEKMKQNADLSKKYTNLISEIKSQINALSDAEAVNDFFNKIKSMEAIWDSEFVAKNELNKKIKEIGVIFNKESKKFEKEGENNVVSNNTNAS